MNYDKIIEDFKTYMAKENSTNKAKAFVDFVKKNTGKSISIGSAHNFLTKKGSLKGILGYFQATTTFPAREHLAWSNWKIFQRHNEMLEGTFELRIQFTSGFFKNNNFQFMMEEDFDINKSEVSLRKKLSSNKEIINIDYQKDNSFLQLYGKRKHCFIMESKLLIGEGDILEIQGMFTTKMSNFKDISDDRYAYFYDFFYTKPEIFGEKNIKLIERKLSFKTLPEYRLFIQTKYPMEQIDVNEYLYKKTAYHHNDFELIRFFLLKSNSI